MERRELLTGMAGGVAALSLSSRPRADEKARATRPNILWLTIEDTSAHEFGCYGHPAAKTPTLDALAARGVLFTRAWAAGPQCSPSRASIITGSFATTYGMDWHRRGVEVPNDIFFPRLLREAGYYCTNNVKTDYNAKVNPRLIWDENSPQASYNSPRRKPGQPFFAVFNCNATHMSRVRSFNLEGRRDFAAEGPDPAKLPLPPHVPDLPQVRSDYAYHLEGVQDIDGWVDVFLEDLKTKGLDEDTLVFFYSDHGGCLPRGKGFVYETGLRVALIVYVPPKWRHLCRFAPGTKSDRLVELLDLGPTVLSLAGLKPPERMQGRAFLGQHEVAPRALQFGFAANQAAHFVPSRTVSDGRFKLVRSYTPHKPLCLRNSFQWGMPSNLAWDEYVLSGRCQRPEWLQPYRPQPAERLFDLHNDPFEVRDLASDARHRETLARLRQALDEHLRETGDLGFFPPSARQGDKGIYVWTRQTRYALEELLRAASIAAQGAPETADKLSGYLRSDRPEIRFWGASGFATLGSRARGLTPPAELVQAVSDGDAYVAAEAAHALCYLGRADVGAPALVKAFEAGSPAAYSALETLALTSAGRDALRPHVAELKRLAGPNKGPGNEDGEGSDGAESGDKDWQARAVLVNLREMPVDGLYGAGQQHQGRKVNTQRRALLPRP